MILGGFKNSSIVNLKHTGNLRGTSKQLNCESKHYKQWINCNQDVGTLELMNKVKQARLSGTV